MPTAMRFLADENCDVAVVRALRADGHDVRAVQESRPGALDEEVLSWAVAENRVLLTEDKDFGHIVHVHAMPSLGVVLIRFPASTRRIVASSVCDAVRRFGDRMHGNFLVIEPGRVRIGRGLR